MRKHLHDYLYLSLAERRGLVAILILIIIVLATPFVYALFFKKESTDFAAFLKEIENFESIDNTLTLDQEKPSPVNNVVAELFYFDPNKASKRDLLRLGLSEKTAQTIVNYRQKGGRFWKKEDLKSIYNLKEGDYERLVDFVKIKKSASPPIANNATPKSYDTPQKIPLRPSFFDPNSADENVLLENGFPAKVASNILKYRSKGGFFKSKEDLKKIYGMTEETYHLVEPYIQIAPQKRKIVKASAQRPPDLSKTRKVFEIDVNNASPEEWQRLRGIGPAFSKRIVKFRDALGGFYSIDQVGETYGLPDSTFQSIRLQLKLSPIFKMININQASVDILKQHPYIKWNQANLIINYRKMHGEFSDVNELLKIGGLQNEWFEKVKPYLRI